MKNDMETQRDLISRMTESEQAVVQLLDDLREAKKQLTAGNVDASVKAAVLPELQQRRRQRNIRWFCMAGRCAAVACVMMFAAALWLNGVGGGKQENVSVASTVRDMDMDVLAVELSMVSAQMEMDYSDVALTSGGLPEEGYASREVNFTDEDWFDSELSDLELQVMATNSIL